MTIQRINSNDRLSAAATFEALVFLSGQVPTQSEDITAQTQEVLSKIDALLAETGSPRLAALFILHDAHEWVLGDMITPVVQALSMRVAAVASWNYGEAPREDLFRTALRDLKKRTDAAIFAAAGIDSSHLVSGAGSA